MERPLKIDCRPLAWTKIESFSCVCLLCGKGTPDLEEEEEDDEESEDDDEGAPAIPTGVPDPYYPIALPIDQEFKTKYVFHHRRGKTFQERLYVFLEHPGGWICFVYHFSV